MIKGVYNEYKVTIDDVVLDPKFSRGVRDYSSEFMWGYGGSGPSQLALALLLFFGASENEAMAYYQELKRDLVARLPEADFEIENSKVVDWLEARRLFEREFPE